MFKPEIVYKYINTNFVSIKNNENIFKKKLRIKREREKKKKPKYTEKNLLRHINC